MHASSANGHQAALPSLKGLARILAGRASPNGKSVRFDMSGDKQRRYRMTLTLAPHMPYGFIVEDPAGQTPWQEVQAYVLDMVGIPRFEDERPQNSGPRNGASHRTSGRSVVRDAEAAVAVPREGAAVPSFTPPAVLDADELTIAPAPDRRWAVHGVIPADVPTLFAGDGGQGKTTVAMQLGHCFRWEAPWLGQRVTGGSAVYYSAEEPEDELHFRLQQIQEGVPFKGTAPHAFKLISLADRDALLAVPGSGRGVMAPTPMFGWLEHVVAEHKAALLILDAVADVFGGDEIDRGQVRSFLRLLRGLGMRQGCAVVLLAHPSVSGMSTGRDYSGSTAWNNSVRSRLTLKTEGGDLSFRELSMPKTNRAAPGWKLSLRWHRGAFHVENGSAGGVSPLQLAKAKAVFLELLQKGNDQGRTLSDKSGKNYAPHVLEEQGKARDVTKHQMELAMSALFDDCSIKLVPYGREDRGQMRLIVNRSTGGEGDA